MTLKVLEDDRAGYALLVFDPLPASPLPTHVAIRRFWNDQNADLGPGGIWAKAPHYFAAEATVTADGRPCLRVGPDIVDHLHDYDRIEVSDAAGTLREEGYWEDIPVSGSSGGIRSDGGDTNGGDETGGAGTTDGGGTGDDGTGGGGAGGGGGVGTGSGGGGRVPRRTVIMFLSLGLLAVAMIGFEHRCSWLGIACPMPQPAAGSDEAEHARACLARKTAASDWCEADAQCVEPYRRGRPDPAILRKLETVATTAETECRKSAEAAAANAAQLCLDRKTFDQGRCSAAVDCLGDYLRRFPNGARRPDLESRATTAAGVCEQAKVAPPPPPSPERRALDEAHRCAATAAPCVAAACYANLPTTGGTEVIRQAQAEKAAREAECHQAPAVSAMADGLYSARAETKCGATQRFLEVRTGGGRIDWDHQIPVIPGGAPTTFHWQGTVDGTGTITARVVGNDANRANGRYAEDDRTITMHYSFCPQSVSMTIRQRLH